ncbi:3,4-dihydroxy-2-butanone-4-phosphate synthase [Aureococcus anophagefferens]|uniref:GTP cyclohydrolase II n=1 Tax=Aureococcus anophagefferens TaxID=44056 RepID=A0ABR1G3Y9_AURAN
MRSKPPVARAPEYAQPPAVAAPRPRRSAPRRRAARPATPARPTAPPPPSSARAVTRMPTAHGLFDAVCYAEPASGVEHIALLAGDVECATGDIFGSRRCDCGEQLQRSLELVRASGGVLLYLRGHEGRGIGLGAKLRAYALQDRGRDTIEANADQGLPVEARTYGAAAAMLRDLGVGAAPADEQPGEVRRLAAFGIAVAARVPLVTTPNEDNVAYLRTKQARMGRARPPEAP